VAGLRGLNLKAPLQRGVLTRDEIGAKLKDRIGKEYTPDEVRQEARVLKRLGLLPADVDYEKLLLDLLMEQVAGFYDPFAAKLYIADWLPLEMQRPALAHEIEHALQDQHFDLRAFQGYVRGQTDTMVAHSCLAEGDATEATGERPSESASDYISRELVAPYAFGSAFVHALRAKGGWAEVDRAWKTPLTTEHVLHPEKWIAGERAESVPAPKSKARLTVPSTCAG